MSVEHHGRRISRNKIATPRPHGGGPALALGRAPTRKVACPSSRTTRSGGKQGLRGCVQKAAHGNSSHFLLPPLWLQNLIEGLDQVGPLGLRLRSRDLHLQPSVRICVHHRIAVEVFASELQHQRVHPGLVGRCRRRCPGRWVGRLGHGRGSGCAAARLLRAAVGG
jgi:hypothetical protein